MFWICVQSLQSDVLSEKWSSVWPKKSFGRPTSSDLYERMFVPPAKLQLQFRQKSGRLQALFVLIQLFMTLWHLHRCAILGSTSEFGIIFKMIKIVRIFTGSFGSLCCVLLLLLINKIVWNMSVSFGFWCMVSCTINVILLHYLVGMVEKRTPDNSMTNAFIMARWWKTFSFQ